MASQLVNKPAKTRPNHCPVLLGFQDAEVDGIEDFRASKIGGLPNLPGASKSLTSHLENASRCAVCNQACPLVAQIYAPMDNSIYDRTLYIFACVRMACWNNPDSWSCLRVQAVSTYQRGTAQETDPQKPATRPKQSWFEDENDWGDEDEEDSNNFSVEGTRGMAQSQQQRDLGQDVSPAAESTSSDDTPDCSKDLNANRISNVSSMGNGLNGLQGATGMQADTSLLEIATAVIEQDQDSTDNIALESPVPEDRVAKIAALFSRLDNESHVVDPTNELPVFRSFYLAVHEEEERLESTMSAHELALLMEYQKLEDKAPNSSQGSDISDGYEKAIPKHGDTFFHKFWTVVNRNPGQLIRYYMGRDVSPILVAAPEYKTPLTCVHCGSEARCELQILPTLISFLSVKNDTDLESATSPSYPSQCPLEFGNALVFTCIRSCWDDTDMYRRENVLLQRECL